MKKAAGPVTRTKLSRGRLRKRNQSAGQSAPQLLAQIEYSLLTRQARTGSS